MVVSHIQTPQVQGSIIDVVGRWYLVKCRAIWTSGAGLFSFHRISILLVHSLDLESLTGLLSKVTWGLKRAFVPLLLWVTLPNLQQLCSCLVCLVIPTLLKASGQCCYWFLLLDKSPGTCICSRDACLSLRASVHCQEALALQLDRMGKGLPCMPPFLHKYQDGHSFL